MKKTTRLLLIMFIGTLITCQKETVTLQSDLELRISNFSDSLDKWIPTAIHSNMKDSTVVYIYKDGRKIKNRIATNVGTRADHTIIQSQSSLPKIFGVIDTPVMYFANWEYYSPYDPRYDYHTNSTPFEPPFPYFPIQISYSCVRLISGGKTIGIEEKWVQAQPSHLTYYSDIAETTVTQVVTVFDEHHTQVCALGCYVYWSAKLNWRVTVNPGPGGTITRQQTISHSRFSP